MARCEPIFSTPAVSGASGLVLFGCMDGRLYAVTPQGEVRWTFDAGGPIFSAPCLFLAAAAAAAVAAAVRPSPAPAATTPAPGDVGAEGGGAALEERVLFTAQSGRLFCLEAAAGARRWAQPAEVHGHSSPAVDTACGHPAARGGASGAPAAYLARVAVVGAVDGTVHAFAAADGAPLGTVRLGGAVFSSAAVCAGRVVVGCRDDHLYCLALRRRPPPPHGPGDETRSPVGGGGGEEEEAGPDCAAEAAGRAPLPRRSPPSDSESEVDERRVAALRRILLLRGAGSTAGY
jgi:outer membrane protein assembly factor BamB